MDSLYLLKRKFIQSNKIYLWWIILLILCKVTTLIYIESSAFQTHSVYWDPDNIIFQTKPVPLLRVKPKDEIIFVCAQESLYILWTYEYQVFESCSMWLNDNLMVNLLLRCPDKSSRRIKMRDVSNIRQKKLSNLITDQKTIMKSSSQNSSIKNYSGYHSPISKHNLTHMMEYLTNRSSKIINKRSLLSLQPVIPNSQLTDRKKYPSQFTLLVEEFAWANGNPSFPVNRPVYFLAQPSVCHSRNMRLGIVNGEFTGLLSDPYANRLFQETLLSNHSGLIAYSRRNLSFPTSINSKCDRNHNKKIIQKNIPINEQQHDQQRSCTTDSVSPVTSSASSIFPAFSTNLIVNHLSKYLPLNLSIIPITTTIIIIIIGTTATITS
ncbi:unnamed protein product [Trichobilharzia szidati]|nr:unnamed protein product [Trichobilharzia szidati]